MFMFFTTSYVIIIALILILLITLTISLPFIYYIKRKYDLYERHPKIAKKKLNKNIYDLKFQNRNFFKTITNLIKYYIKNRGSI